MKVSIAKPDLGKKERSYLLKAFDSGYISSLGEFIPKFEEKFAKFAGTRHATTASNGTTAIHLILEALGVEGKEVITPSLTFAASASTILHARGRPVLADCGEDWNIDPAAVRNAITEKTAGIIAVHLYGQPSAMGELREIAEEKGLFLVEDCAEALGAKYCGKNVGCMGNAGSFSFYGNKVITTGEGGMVTTNDSELFQRMVELKNHGMTKQKKYWHDVVGYNYRMTNLQAAIGLAQLERIGEIIRKREAIAKFYGKNLDKGKFELQKDFPGRKKVPWLYPALMEDGKARDEAMAGLEKRGIETRRFFYPLHLMRPYAQAGSFVVSESISERGLLLPCHTLLKKKELGAICGAANEI